MPIELSHLMQLAAGQKTSMHVGDLPRPVAEKYNCHPAVVFLGHEELLKITKKHKDIQVTEFQFLSMAIRYGCYRTDDQNRPNHLTILYTRPDSSDTYLIGLKSAQNGREMWVATYYRISGRKLKKKIQRTGVIYQRLK